MQMNRDSTLVSYLHWLLIAAHRQLRQAGDALRPHAARRPSRAAHPSRDSPVAGAPIIGGLVPCNVIADEILTDHPKRYRAMLVEAANPAHSLADSKRMREALDALDTLVVIDVAHDRDGAARRTTCCRPRRSSRRPRRRSSTSSSRETSSTCAAGSSRRPPGPLPEAEIHARLVEALGAITEDDLRRSARPPRTGRRRTRRRSWCTCWRPPARAARAGPPLPHAAAPRRAARRRGRLRRWRSGPRSQHRPSLARAGFGGSPLEAARALFTAILESPSGVVFAVDELGRRARAHRDPRPEDPPRAPRSPRGAGDAAGPPRRRADPAFPFVLSAGERRSFTANTIIRDPAWRKKDAGRRAPDQPRRRDGARRPLGDRVRLTTRRDSVIVAVEVSDDDAARPRLAAQRARARLPRRRPASRRPASRRTSSPRPRIAIRSSARRGTSTSRPGSSACESGGDPGSRAAHPGLDLARRHRAHPPPSLLASGEQDEGGHGEDPVGLSGLGVLLHVDAEHDGVPCEPVRNHVDHHEDARQDSQVGAQNSTRRATGAVWMASRSATGETGCGVLPRGRPRHRARIRGRSAPRRRAGAGRTLSSGRRPPRFPPDR